MELTLQSLKEHRQEFLDAGYSLPEFDYDKVMENTRKNKILLQCIYLKQERGNTPLFLLLS